jgi:hypothetical protein
MSTIHDDEFGKITIRRSARANHVRVKVAPDGTLRASLPLYAPLFLVKRLLKNSRSDLRQIIAQSRPQTTYKNGMQIGKSHSLVVQTHTLPEVIIKRHRQQIIVQLPLNKTLADLAVIQKLRTAIIAALRIEAKSYLPQRLKFLAAKLDCNYTRVRFSHASSRWGSCSSSGTISLNVALMKLPFELIDYVLVHELSHLKVMNHSPAFWRLVEQGDPQYLVHRRALKHETPSI